MHYATMPTAPLLGGQFNIWQIPKLTTSHCQITIFTSPLLHCKLDKFTLFYGLPKKSIDYPICFLSVFCPIFFLWAVFFWGGWGACISGLPSYLLAYILTNLHPHLLSLPIHLSTYLPRCRPLSSPTYNLGYQLMTKFASMQVYKFTNLQI